jgi:hypothetical protein
MNEKLTDSFDLVEANRFASLAEAVDELNTDFGTIYPLSAAKMVANGDSIAQKIFPSLIYREQPVSTVPLATEQSPTPGRAFDIDDAAAAVQAPAAPSFEAPTASGPDESAALQAARQAVNQHFAPEPTISSLPTSTVWADAQQQQELSNA